MNNIVQILNMKQDHFNILRKVYKNLGFSKTNVQRIKLKSRKTKLLFKRIKKKGLLKVKNFKQNPKKINYLYVLTPQGIAEN